jgi:hypothetical protein
MDETADLADYSSAIHDLCKHLYRYYNELVYVFIDEYDTPLHYAKLNGYYDEMLNITRALMVDGMKDNHAIKQCIITGIMKIAGESIFSAFNNPKIATMSDRFAQDKFGFMENEVLEMLEYYGLQKRFDDVKHWYNGYRFGDAEIYNQWSILNFVDSNGVSNPYWANTGDPALIRRVMQLDTTYSKEMIEKLLDGQSIKVELATNIVYEDVFSSVENVYSFLYHRGYLKAKWIVDSQYYVQIPNQELKTIYLSIISDWLKKDMLRGSTSLNDLIKSMLKNDEASFTLKLKDIMLKNTSYYDIAQKEKYSEHITTPENKDLTKYENFYHGLFLGMMLQLQDDYTVESNKEYGLGRPDIIVTPKDATQYGYIIELKRNNRREDKTVEELADEALKQIDEMKYLEGVKDKAAKWLKIGIGYKGKDCEAFFVES